MFHGSLVALVTPMQADGTVDIDGLRSLVEWHIEQKTDGIVVLGTTGEAPTLTPGEQKLIIQETIIQARNRIPIIAGTGTNSTAATIQKTKEAMALGVDACLVVAPYYNKPMQEGVYLHFKAIAEAAAIPIIIYNHPGRTGFDIKSETVARLSTIPNIVGLKDATGDINRVKEILACCDHSLDIYGGVDDIVMDLILAGGKGSISVIANILPNATHEMCHYALAGDRGQASLINSNCMELYKLLSVETNPIPVKWALYAMGKIPAGIRLPLTILSDKYREAMRNTLVNVGAMSNNAQITV